MYVRKTVDSWVLEGNYGCGWEYILTEYTRSEGLARLGGVQRKPAGVSGKAHQEKRAKRSCSIRTNQKKMMEELKDDEHDGEISCRGKRNYRRRV